MNENSKKQETVTDKQRFLDPDHLPEDLTPAQLFGQMCEESLIRQYEKEMRAKEDYEKNSQ